MAVTQLIPPRARRADGDGGGRTGWVLARGDRFEKPLELLNLPQPEAAPGFVLIRGLRTDSGIAEKVFFYDLSEQKLFAAPRTAVPPIRGLNDPQTDAVRAVAIASLAAGESRRGPDGIRIFLRDLLGRAGSGPAGQGMVWHMAGTVRNGTAR